jgi:hypothetical protein
VLVTGDSDSLDIAARAPLAIVSPRGFWNMAKGGFGSETGNA